MKIDFLGEYDEYKIPHGFDVPLLSDPENNAISCGNGTILGTYNFINESVLLAHAKRRAEFAVMLANGEIILDFGKVFKRTSSQYQDGKIVVSYEPIDAVKEVAPDATKSNGNGHSSNQEPSLVQKVVETVKRRGRPRKK